MISCDNEFELYIARRRVAAGSDWTRPQVVALAGQLKKGENEIVVVARNLGNAPNPAGFYFESRLVCFDSPSREIRRPPN